MAGSATGVEVGAGVSQKIRIQSADGDVTWLLQFDAVLDTSETITHDFWEEVWILEGELMDLGKRQTFTAGMYACRPPGMVHGPYRVPKGCVTFSALLQALRVRQARSRRTSPLLDEDGSARASRSGACQRNVHDAPEEGHALVEPHHRHRIGAPLRPRGAARITATGDGALAREGHGGPVPLLAPGAELLGRYGELPALAAADAREPAGAGLFEEVLQRQHALSHGRRGSRARWRCCPRACG